MSGLRLIEYSSEDYRIADILSRPHLEKVNDANKISAAFSLFFQWKEYRRCFIKCENDNFVECELEVDQDLAVPTELIAVLKKSTHTLNPATARIRFEIFRTCFEFSCPVTGDLSEGEELRIAIDIPTEVYIHKARSCPRYTVPPDNPIRNCLWMSAGGSEFPVEITDISVKVLHISTNNLNLDATGTIHIDGYQFKAKILRKTLDGYVAQLTFEVPQEYGKFFDRFIKVAYPDLRPRHEFKDEEIYDLYLDTGYMASFGVSGDGNEVAESQRREQLTKYWSESTLEEHVNKVDYILTDSAGKACGSSGIAKIFRQNGKAIWALHQLCSKKDPGLLAGSGRLFCWRVEYLEGLHEPVEAVVWYKSNSKWLERIFTKLSIANSQDTTLTPVYLKRCYRGAQQVLSAVVVDFNGFRKTASIDNVLIGSGPEFLNASRLFEIVWATDNSINEDQFRQACNVYEYISSGNIFGFYSVSIPSNTDLALEQETRPTDRCFRISQTAFSDLTNSVEHSIAVTKKKQASK